MVWRPVSRYNSWTLMLTTVTSAGLSVIVVYASVPQSFITLHYSMSTQMLTARQEVTFRLEYYVRD